MLELHDVHTYYGESHVLRGVSLSVPERSVVALLGRNGMGKTTTVHSVIGFTPCRRGAITFKGESLSKLPANAIAARGLAIVPQTRRIFPSLTVRENLTVATRRRKDGRTWTLNQIYALFPVLETRANVPGTALSGGEQQMLAVARALMTAPDVILMDEPSEGLAPLMITQIKRIIGELRAAGLSILLVEQNLGLALSVADTVYILDKGVIVYQGTPAELHANEDIKTRHLGASV